MLDRFTSISSTVDGEADGEADWLFSEEGCAAGCPIVCTFTMK